MLAAAAAAISPVRSSAASLRAIADERNELTSSALRFSCKSADHGDDEGVASAPPRDERRGEPCSEVVIGARRLRID